MNLRIHDPRIVAIDLRIRRSGYAAFEGPRRLLDFGTSVIRSGRDHGTENGFAELLRLSSPQFIVVKAERWLAAESDSEGAALVTLLKKESERFGIEIRVLGHPEISTTFSQLGCENKNEINGVLARIFPELIWLLPQRRKAWQPEHFRQTIFDAVAIGFAYWQHQAVPFNAPIEFH